MRASRTSLRILSLLSPILGSLLCACGTGGGGDADGPPVFTGVQGNSPAPFASGNGGSSAAPPAGPGAPPVTGTPLSPNEGTQTGQVPVTGNMGSGMSASGSAGSGAGGSGSTGNPGMGSAGAASMPPAGAAGSGMMPPQNPTLPTPPGQAFFFDDFESGAPGTQPAAWDRWINYTTQAGNALGNPQYALLDDGESFSGNQSIHFHAEGASQPAMLTMELPEGLNRIHIRAYVKSSIPVGGVARDTVSNHESLIGLRAVPNDGNDEIRFGGAKGALGFNMVGPGRNDAVAPGMDLWGSGPGMTPNTWHCVEIDFINEGTPRATATIDGTVVRDVTAPTDWHIPVSNTWLDELYTEVFIGWQSFSPQPANDVWMDDVVLSTQPIGCQ